VQSDFYVKSAYESSSDSEDVGNDVDESELSVLGDLKLSLRK
jgi:hypothetical protein